MGKFSYVLKNTLLNMRRTPLLVFATIIAVLVSSILVFTTLSANRYHSGQSSKKSAHIDSGDTEFGMTTMSVFREGDYTGAYLTFPRYGVAIDAPDNSVVIADSRQVHGVTQIYGTGQRFSCVAYCDNRLATKGVAGKSERLIGKYAKSGTLEEFISP